MKRYVGIGATHGLPARAYQLCAILPSLSVSRFIVFLKLSIPILPRLTLAENRFSSCNSSVRFGSLAASHHRISLTTAIGCKADITPTVFTDDLRPQWGPRSRSRRGKLTFPKIINDPVYHAAAILKGPFSEIFFKNKRDQIMYQRSDLLGGILFTAEPPYSVQLKHPQNRY